MPIYYPRRRYRRRRRRRYNRKSSGFSATGAFSMAKKAFSMAKYLATLINVEKKVLVTANGPSVDSSGSVTDLSAIAQGSGQSQRDGNSIKLKSLRFSSSITRHTSATTTRFRVIVFKDLQQAADTAPGVTDILQNAGVQSGLNIVNVGRFSILADKLVYLSDGSNSVAPCNFNLKLDQHCRFNGTLSTDSQKGSLYLLLLSDQPTNTPSIDYNAQVRYIDN